MGAGRLDRAARHMNRPAGTLFKCAAYFVAGTDTGVGKTRVTGGLLKAAREQGARAAGMKPVAAGSILKDGRQISEDALYIAHNSGQISPYELLNPYCLPEPLSPHIAADRAGARIEVGQIVRNAQRLAADRDLLLIEGAGGWYAPISNAETMADVARALAVPVVLVVGLRLGCLNHALLTAQAIERCGCVLRGWIGSQVEPQWSAREENIATLARLLGAAPLALLAHGADSGGDAAQLRTAAAELLGRAD
jgi:dethiobiotin synthetase